MPRNSPESVEAAELLAVEHSPQAKRLSLARLGVLCLLALGLISAYLTRHCLAVANTTIQAELEFNNREFGYLYGAFSAGYLLFQVPGGWLGQRWGTRVTMPLLGILWSAATLATALVATLPAMIVARFVFGLAQAGLIPNQAKVVNDWFPPASRGATSSVIVTSMSVGGVASLWLTAWLMRSYDWRTVFCGYSLIGIAWAILFFVLFRCRPADVRWLSDHDRERDQPGSQRVSRPGALTPARATPARTNPTRTNPTRAILGSRNVWGLAAQLLFKTAGYNLLVTFYPALLEYAYETSREDAGALASWALIGLVFGSLLGGIAIDRVQQRTHNKRLSRCAIAAASLLFTAAAMCAASLATTDEQWAAAMTIAAFFSGISLPCTWAAVVDIGGENSGLVMGYVNVGSCLAGIAITPAVGHLIDHLRAVHGNWNLVIFVHAAFYLASALCWLVVDPGQSIGSPESRHAV